MTVPSARNTAPAIKPAITNRVLKGLQEVARDFPSLDRPDPLSEREVEILGLMCGGYSNREIAEALFLAEGTVKNHISNILSKLGVRDRTRAVLKARNSAWRSRRRRSMALA